MRPEELARRIASKTAPVIVDVRSSMEFNMGHIPGALHAPNLKLLFNAAQLPDDKNSEIVITCEHGPRAQLARGVLSLYGYKNTTLLDGHMNRWRNAKLPITR